MLAPNPQDAEDVPVVDPQTTREADPGSFQDCFVFWTDWRVNSSMNFGLMIGSFFDVLDEVKQTAAFLEKNTHDLE